MVRRSKTAIALLGGIIWIFLLKTAVALPFPAMEGLEMPIQAMNEFFEPSSSVISDRAFSRSYPALQRRFSSPEAGGKTSFRPSLLAFHFAEGRADHGREIGFRKEFRPIDASILAGLDGIFVSTQFGLEPRPMDRVSIARKASVLAAVFSAAGRKGFDGQDKAGSSTIPTEKPLLSGIMAAEPGMACSNPLTGPGSRNPATFTLMAVGFAGMVAGRFRMNRF